MLPVIYMTQNASQKILELAHKENTPEHFLRLIVDGGGCAGFQYIFKLDYTIADDDQIFEKDGAKVVVDAISLQFVKGSTIDHIEDLTTTSFVVNNPNSASSCGCGNSFSL